MNEIQIFENEGLNLKVRAILQDNGDILIILKKYSFSIIDIYIYNLKLSLPLCMGFFKDFNLTVGRYSFYTIKR